MSSSSPDPPKSIGMVIYPGFQALDVFGILDALQTTAIRHHLKFSLLALSLEPVTNTWILTDPATKSPQFAQSILPTHTFDTAPDDIDVLIVPGGTGARDEETIKPVVQFVKSRLDSDSLRYVLSVCTGALLVGRTGHFDGQKATTNKAAFNRIRGLLPDIDWVPKARWVEGEKWWSSSGIGAGTDMALGWIEHIWGAEQASRVEMYLEWTRMGREDDKWADFHKLEGSK